MAGHETRDVDVLTSINSRHNFPFLPYPRGLLPPPDALGLVSWHQRQRFNISTKTSVSTIQHSRSSLSEPRLIYDSVNRGEGGSTVNFTSLVAIPRKDRVHPSHHALADRKRPKLFLQTETLSIPSPTPVFDHYQQGSGSISRTRQDLESRFSLADNCMWGSSGQQIAEMSRSSSP